MNEDVVTITYLVNKCPSTTIDYNTLEYLWTGYKSNMSNLKVYRQAYARQKERKLEYRVIECVFLDYSKGICGCMNLTVLK